MKLLAPSVISNMFRQSLPQWTRAPQDHSTKKKTESSKVSIIDKVKKTFSTILIQEKDFQSTITHHRLLQGFLEDLEVYSAEFLDFHGVGVAAIWSTLQECT